MTGAPVTVLSPAGDVGFGFDVEAISAEVAEGVDAVAVQGTSTDPGAFYLGTGSSYIPRTGVVNDLKRLIPLAIEAGVPLLVSTGGAGTDHEVDAIVEELRRWAAAEAVRFELAVLRTSVPRDALSAMLDAGAEIPPVDEATRHLGVSLTASDVEQAENVVAQVGPEPFMEALGRGAEVVIAGRALDVAMYAAVPLMRGIPPEVALLMAKTLECGGQVGDPGSLVTGAVGTAFDDSFVVRPTDPGARCTPTSVMAHILYEEGHGTHLTFPGEQVGIDALELQAIDARSVRVSGIRRRPPPPRSIKIEGARIIGYRALCLTGIKDPDVLKAMPAALASLDDVVEREYGNDHELRAQLYGGGDVAAAEACLLLEVVADRPETARDIANLAKGYLMHLGFAGRKTTSGNLAMFFSPNVIEVGPVCEFNIFHLVPSDDPWAFCRMEIESAGRRRSR